MISKVYCTLKINLSTVPAATEVIEGLIKSNLLFFRNILYTDLKVYSRRFTLQVHFRIAFFGGAAKCFKLFMFVEETTRMNDGNTVSIKYVQL